MMSLTPRFCSFGRLLFCAKVTCGSELTSQTDNHSPRFSSSGAAVEAYIFVTGGVVFPFALVPTVLKVISLSEIGNSIVVFIAILVIYLRLWVYPVYPEPRQSVSEVISTVDPDDDVTFRGLGPCNFPVRHPRENPGSFLVLEGRANQISRQVVSVSHSVGKKKKASSGK